MNLLIRQQRTYEKVYYDDEKHFVGIVKVELTKIFDGFSIIDFTPFIMGDEGSRRRPDLAIIDRAYRMWVVVEVELDRHSLQHHVIPQVQTFVAGNYEEPHAHLLHDRDPDLFP